MSSTLKESTVEINYGGAARSMHQNGGIMGFLNTSGGWDMYANNSGQIWTPNYGWLHDYFSRAMTRTMTNGGPAGRNAGSSGNCGNIPGSYTTYFAENNSGGFDMYYITNNCSNCNCNCVCTCK
jgi:hypothetical protein